MTEALKQAAVDASRAVLAVALDPSMAEADKIGRLKRAAEALASETAAEQAIDAALGALKSE